jgi:hypothetical protein
MSQAMRRFTHLGIEWEVESVGDSSSNAASPGTPIWGVRFRTVSNPPRIHTGHIGERDLNRATDDELRAALEAAIASAATGS